MGLSSRSFRVSSTNRKIQDVPDATPVISAVSDGGAAGSTFYDGVKVSVSSTVTTGGIPDAYKVVATPGSITAVGGSPVEVRGLTPGTSYTFTATPQTSAGTLGTTSAVSAAAIPTGAIVPIATTTGASMNFTNIPSAYQDLMITGWIRGTNASSIEYGFFTLNGASSGYSHTAFAGDGSTAASIRNNISGNGSVFLGSIIGNSATSNRFSYFTIHIFGYKDQSKLKTFIAQISSDQVGSGETRVLSGLWSSYTAINSLFIFGVNGTNVLSGATLYGIKAASK